MKVFARACAVFARCGSATRRAFVVGLLAWVALLVVACPSSGGSGGRACVDDSVCESGQVCGSGGSCQSVPCATRRDCPGSSTCLASSLCGPVECANTADCGADSGRICRDGVCLAESSLPACGDGGTCQSGKVCNTTANRCEDCSTTAAALRCPNGFACRSGSCEATTLTCTNDAACLPSGRLCDTTASTCVACSTTRVCPASYTCDAGQCKARTRCTNNTCPQGLSCDTSTNFCINAAGVDLCGACTADPECRGTGSKCLALGGSTFCGKTCTSSTDCPANFTCAPTQGNIKQCIPSAGRCTDNCAVPGAVCPQGRTCEPNSGLCLATKRLCDTCTTDSECGAPGDKCLIADGGAKVCGQNCDTATSGGRLCPNGFACRDVSAGVKQCLPQGAECVVDPCATVTCDRASTTPICDPATRACVECLRQADCPASDQQCTAAKTCVVPGQCTTDQSCASDPGGRKCCTTASGKQCSQCCTNNDCSGGTPFCVVNTCQAQQDPCAGVSCGPSTACNPASGQCEATGGGGTSCQSDNDCPPSALGTPQSCDIASHTCYDPSGVCADASQCAPGQQCLIFCTCASDADCRGALICNELFPGFGICGA